MYVKFFIIYYYEYLTLLLLICIAHYTVYINDTEHSARMLIIEHCTLYISLYTFYSVQHHVLFLYKSICNILYHQHITYVVTINAIASKYILPMGSLSLLIFIFAMVVLVFVVQCMLYTVYCTLCIYYTPNSVCCYTAQ